jgi:hypothetical protein
MQKVTDLLDLEIDKFQLCNEGRQPTLIRLGRHQVASLQQCAQLDGVGEFGPPSYRDIPVEELDDVSHLALW